MLFSRPRARCSTCLFQDLCSHTKSPSTLFLLMALFVQSLRLRTQCPLFLYRDLCFHAQILIHVPCFPWDLCFVKERTPRYSYLCQPFHRVSRTAPHYGWRHRTFRNLPLVARMFSLLRNTRRLLRPRLPLVLFNGNRMNTAPHSNSEYLKPNVPLQSENSALLSL